MPEAFTPQEGLTAGHHTMLFALLARAVIKDSGEQAGAAAIRKAVRTYGRERGRRMALRAQANGHPLSMANYLTYSEWQPVKNESRFRLVEKVPHARVLVDACIWHRIWKENDLLDYGRLYCLEIDLALVQGFNPELRLDIRQSLADGHPRCDFVFKNANLTVRNALLTAFRKRVKPGKTCRMPWDYHCGHLYKTTKDVVARELGLSGRFAVESARATFAERYGKAAARTVDAFLGTDFNALPA